MDFFILAILGAIVFLGLAAVQWGTDSRSTIVEPTNPSANGLS